MSDPIMDAMDLHLARKFAAKTPAAKAYEDVALSYCHWALIHDATERMFGDPGWFRDPYVEPPNFGDANDER